MATELSSEQVWKELDKELFGVLGMVTARGEARTIGIVYIVDDKKLYIATGEDAWKARHVRNNPSVSITVPIAKRIPFMPWIKIPSATISFSGKATFHKPNEVGQELLHRIFRGAESDAEAMAGLCLIEIEPVGDFITFGVGVPMMTMRDPLQARGRAPVSA
jgi:hypothetical protein